MHISPKIWHFFVLTIRVESQQKASRVPRHSLALEADSRTLARRLLRASEEGDIALCRQLIANGADVDGGPDAKCTPLIKALRKGHDGVAKLLIDKGADFHRGACQKVPCVGYQALHFATWKGGLDLLQWILSKNPRMSDRGVEPIHIAAIQNKTVCLTALLDHERRRGTGSVRRMLDVQVRCNKDPPRMCLSTDVYTIGSLTTGTPLHLASWAGHIDAVKLLLRYGANADTVDSNSRTPLHQASERAHVPVLKLLLEAGASVYSRDCDGYTPLSLAVKSGSLEAVDLLLEWKSDKDVQDRYGRTCTHLSLCSDKRELLHKLLELGMDFNARSYDGDTALHFALQKGDPELIQFAIDHAPVPDVPQKQYGSILNAACAFASGSHIKVLLSRAEAATLRDYVNYRSEIYGTPLYAAAYRGDTMAVKALLNAGASIDVQGGQLGTAFDAACAMGRENIVAVLLRKGANPFTTDPEEPAQPFTSPFESVRRVLSCYLEKGLAGLDNPIETAAELAISTTPAAAEAAVEADAAIIPSRNHLTSCRPSPAGSNTGPAELEQQSHGAHSPTALPSHSLSSSPDLTRDTTISFDTSTTVSPLEREMPHSLSVPRTPTRLPREPPPQKTPQHQCQFTLTVPPPQFMREATAHAFDPQLAIVSIPGLDTPAQSVCSEESTVTKESSPITPEQQGTVLDETAQELPEIIMAEFADVFFEHAKFETNDLKTSHRPAQILIDEHAIAEAGTVPRNTPS